MDDSLMPLAHAFLDGRLLLVLSAPFIGSFLYVVAERWPREEPLVLDRSRCPHCKHALGMIDLVPLVSWLAARARCRYCGQRLSIWYPITEVAALIIAVWTVVVLPAELAWISVLFGWTLLTLAVIDLKWLWLPHALTWPLAGAGPLVTGLWNRHLPFDQLIGALAGYLAMVLVAWLYRRYRGRQGLGEGDAHLLGALGAWVGWQGLPSILVYAGVSGLLAVVIRMRREQPVGWTTRIPFGPHLCLGGWLVWLYGPLYLEW
jgi:leader peptidase (prepilin peptidase) / N-methyltransferase